MDTRPRRLMEKRGLGMFIFLLTINVMFWLFLTPVCHLITYSIKKSKLKNLLHSNNCYTIKLMKINFQWLNFPDKPLTFFSIFIQVLLFFSLRTLIFLKALSIWSEYLHGRSLPMFRSTLGIRMYIVTFICSKCRTYFTTFFSPRIFIVLLYMLKSINAMFHRIRFNNNSIWTLSVALLLILLDFSFFCAQSSVCACVRLCVFLRKYVCSIFVRMLLM